MCRSMGCARESSRPGRDPIHLGNGMLQAIVDERADARQRAALEAIAHGP